MYYMLSQGQLKEINEVTQEECVIGYVDVETFETDRELFEIPENIIKQCTNIDTNFRSSMQIQGAFLYGSVTVIDVNQWNKNRCQIALVIGPKCCIIVCIVDEEEDTLETFLSAINRCRENTSLEKILYVFLDGFLAGSDEALEKMEKQMVIMEHELVENRMDSSLNKDLFLLKKQLLVLKNYYEQMIDLGETLKEDELDLFVKENRKYFHRFTAKAKRRRDNVQEVKESLVHLREALDANLEYNLNRIMKVFTVVTTVFLPLTLIAGWYGMNFKYMPELYWKYGYVFVGVISILVVVVCFLFFYKKKLL